MRIKNIGAWPSLSLTRAMKGLIKNIAKLHFRHKHKHDCLVDNFRIFHALAYQYEKQYDFSFLFKYKIDKENYTQV